MSRRAILIVLDGLRPDFVTDALTPNLSALARKGVLFANHHAVFPSVTRVNASSIATGCHPGRHGLVDNVLYLPEISPDPIDTGNYQVLQTINRATNGRLLDTSSLTEILGKAGLSVAVATTCTTGACFLQNHRGYGLTVNPGFITPDVPAILAQFGAAPPKRRLASDATEWVTAIATEYIWKEQRPDLMVFWFCDPDHTQHGFGPGAPQALEAIRVVDTCIGRVVQAVDDSGEKNDTNFIVMSDHGWISHSAPLPVSDTFIRAGLKSSLISTEIVVAGQGVYLAPNAGTSVQDIVACLQRMKGIGALFTRDGGCGTFPLADISCAHGRSPDLLVASSWNHAPNAYDIPVSALGDGVGGHGGSSRYEINATLMAAGPDFRKGVVSRVPTGHVDLLPTIIHLLGQPSVPGKDGRVLLEALANGIAETELNTERETLVAENGAYRADLLRTRVGETVYIDQANAEHR